jgi:uncharacterized delta-60 repeat protein
MTNLKAGLALTTLCLLPTAAFGADELEPGFGNGGVVMSALPSEASQKEAGIGDLAAAGNGTTMGALKGLAGTGYFGAVRLMATGDPDPAFGLGGFTAPLRLGREESGLETQAEALAVQGDGKIVVTGYVQQGLRNPLITGPLLARYLPDGSLDSSFGDGGVVSPQFPPSQLRTVFHKVDLAPDGRIIVAAGRNESLRSAPTAAGIVYAYNPDGTLDESFGEGGRVVFSQRRRRTNTSLRDVEITSDGKILVVGYRSYHPFLARLEAGGSLDRSFGGGDGMSVLGSINNGICCATAALTVQPDGRVVVASNGGPRKGRVLLLRYRPNGILDRSFGDHGVQNLFGPWRLSEATDVAVQGNRGILTVGRGERTSANPRGFAYGVFRSRPNARPDRSFGDHGLRTFPYGSQSYAGAALAQPDGGVLTGGSFAALEPGTKRDVTTLLLARFLG